MILIIEACQNVQWINSAEISCQLPDIYLYGLVVVSVMVNGQVNNKTITYGMNPTWKVPFLIAL